MTPRAQLLLTATLLLPGCIFVGGDPPPGPGPTCTVGSCRSKPAQSTATSNILAGVGAPDPGYDGVIITANVGGSYRITWDTSWSGFTEIQGSVFTESGATPQFFPGCMDGSCQLTGGDAVVVGSMAGRIDFAGFPRGSSVRSGFDIVVPAGDRLLLDIATNDAFDAQRVVFVSADTFALASAATMPFALRVAPPCTVGSCRGKPPATVLLSRIKPGAAAPDPGYDGVIITANVGGVYRITWDTKWTGFTDINGSVFTQSGNTPQFVPGCGDGSCALSGADTVVVGGMPGRIDFTGLPRGVSVRGGFDITIGDNDKLILDIATNDVFDPAKVVFVSTDTNALASAPAIPFRLTTQ